MKVQERFWSIKFIKKIEFINKLIINFIILIVILFVIFLLLEIRSQNNLLLNKLIYIDFIVIFVMSYIFFNNYIKTIKINKAKQYISSLEEYNKSLIEVHDKMRGFKHDFNNILQAMNGYIMLKDMNSLEKYFRKLLKESQYVKNVEFINSKSINNPAIYSILLNKYKIAEKKNIKMNIDICLDLNIFNDKIYYISRILGILLDNAIEATSECNEKFINIQFLCDSNCKKKLIIIENTYIDKGIDIQSIFEKNFTTKKENGNSGLGLWEVKNILCKDTDFDLYTTKNDKIFKQQLEIYFN